jgi:ribosome-binding factor A
MKQKYQLLETKNITVTEVRMSPDLKNARAYVIPLGGKDTEKAVESLTEFSHLIRKALSKKIDMKFLPEVSFIGDKSFDYAEKIEKLIQKNK